MNIERALQTEECYSILLGGFKAAKMSCLKQAIDFILLMRWQCDIFVCVCLLVFVV